MKTRNVILALLCFVPVALFSQGLNEKELLQPPTTTWGMYNGDYTARRFSTLKDINDSNVQELSLEWTAQIMGGTPTSSTGGRGGGVARVGGSPLMV
ncbi:MAG TPA: hypothetical protein VIY69_16575, partial [Candidatus Acidoferrales bacterium]